ncbi:hypothetical protein [Shimazuella kribbensis]|uniref:hypothetical protein n=1 Tax=Shimazuella kribbensis TaxID=139808 RepID=UPI0003F5101E|nr:hypothetical protein [Shimazuella kribbensis]
MYIPADPIEAQKAIEAYMKQNLTKEEIDILIDAVKEAKRRVDEQINQLKEK